MKDRPALIDLPRRAQGARYYSERRRPRPRLALLLVVLVLVGCGGHNRARVTSGPSEAAYAPPPPWSDSLICRGRFNPRPGPCRDPLVLLQVTISGGRGAPLGDR